MPSAHVLGLGSTELLKVAGRCCSSGQIDAGSGSGTAGGGSKADLLPLLWDNTSGGTTAHNAPNAFQRLRPPLVPLSRWLSAVPCTSPIWCGRLGIGPRASVRSTTAVKVGEQGSALIVVTLGQQQRQHPMQIRPGGSHLPYSVSCDRCQHRVVWRGYGNRSRS